MSDVDHLRELTAFADRLADAARDNIREAVHKPFGIEIKGDGSPVTEVDKATEDRLRSMIADSHPDHGIMGEEREDVAPDAEFVWIIDPIDGTLPFLAGFPVFGTLIALVHGGAPVIGVIEMPMTCERWVGQEGAQTTRNGAPVKTRPCANLDTALMSTSNPDFYPEADRPALDRLRSASRLCIYGGSCMAYGQIASGRIDVGVDVGFDIHDYLPLVPVITGAGGVITDWDGQALTTQSGDRLVAAGDSRIHGQTLDIIAGGPG